MSLVPIVSLPVVVEATLCLSVGTREEAEGAESG